LRAKHVNQRGLDFSKSNLKITNQYYARYEAVSTVLDQAPKLLDLIHRDLVKALKGVNQEGRRRGRPYAYTSEHVLRILICQVMEGKSLRGIVVRIDDSHFLRRFVRIDDGPMMDYTTLCTLKNAIHNDTWKAVNRCLAGYAVQSELIDGDKLRLDTTAVETNIHYPTDSSLLWDIYRTLDRLIRQAREIDPEAVGTRRLQARRAKRLQQKISRKAANKGRSAQQLKPLYMQLIPMVEDLFGWARSVRKELAKSRRLTGVMDAARAAAIVEQIDHYIELGERVVDQARRRVFEGERVPNEEKLFSIFEPHTELLIRGKAGKNVEFGHMIQIQQVDGKFITDYDVFDKRPVEHGLLESVLENHKKLFGHYPDELAGDKGYYESMDAIDRLQRKVPMVSIAKKGRRTQEETEREHDLLFRIAQRFRAGVEGTIAFLKRMLRLARCFNKGWQHFVSTVGQTILAHNLLVLARC
jgi:IS5 family transposase